MLGRAIWRREVVLSGGLTLLWGTGCPCSVHAQNHQPSRGCLLSEEGAKSLLRRSAGAQLFATGNEPPVQSSGDRQFDYALAHTLSRISDKLGVLPGFAYYEDGGEENAYASPYARLNNSDGTVLYGLNFLRRALRARENPDVGVAAVCAHEFGHILQYKRKLEPVLLNNQPTVKRLELHADFLSGYFAGARKREKPDYPAAIYAVKAHEIGDTAFTDRNHHGTPDERADAVVQGFKAAYESHKSLDDAIQIGINYVSQH